MRKYSLSALVAAGLLVGGLSAGSASAADLGGNCCADLEERIAELEATTARKGNRKVSLTISGWVAEQVMYWDDDFTDESNVYVGGIGTTLASHFKFTGQATISPGWYAGYVIHAEVYGSENLLMTNQRQATGSSLYDQNRGLLQSTDFSGISTLQSFWFIKSDRLGKLSVGLQSQASDNTAILPDGSGSLVPANYVAFDYGGFYAGNGAVAGSDTLWFLAEGCSDCNGLTTNSVRYDSPTFAGFSVSASWGEDDFWDAAARYAGEFNGFKLAVAGAYSEASDSNQIDSIPQQGRIAQAAGTGFYQIGAYLEHVPTGLFAYGAYGRLESNVGATDGDELNRFYYIKAGLRERWSPLGHTVLYGEYKDSDNSNTLFGVRDYQDSQDPTFLVRGTSSVQMWGLGVVQEIDAAAMSLWVSYRHLDGDFTNPGNAQIPGATAGDLDSFQYIKAGALINF